MRSTPERQEAFIALPSLLLLSLAACTAPLEYGDSVAPSKQQREAAEIITDLTLQIDDTRSGPVEPMDLFEAGSLMAQLPGLAVLGSRNPIVVSELVPPRMDSGCVSGTPGTGYIYSDCPTDNGTINGEVNITPLTVSYDLRISSAEGGVNEFNIRGDFNVGDELVIGTMEFRSQVNLPGEGEVAGISPGQTVGDVNTISHWNVAFDPQNRCIADGVVEVEVEAKGQIDGTRFLFAACDEPLRVRNGNQVRLTTPFKWHL